MADTNEAALLEVLRAVPDPSGRTDIVSAGRVDSLTLRNGLVHLALLADRQTRRRWRRCVNRPSACWRAHLAC